MLARAHRLCIAPHHCVRHGILKQQHKTGLAASKLARRLVKLVTFRANRLAMQSCYMRPVP